jgi:hypothetical protein
MTAHDMNPAADTIRRSLQQWAAQQIAMGHPAGLVREVIEAEADRIRKEREQ